MAKLISVENEKPDFLGHRRRARDKILKSGRGVMQDYELLELLLFSALPRRDVKSISKKIIKVCGGLGGALKANKDSLASLIGIGDSVLATLKCVGEILDRVLYDDLCKQPVLENWTKLENYLRTSIGHGQTESAAILFLNKKFCLMSIEFGDVGTVDRVVVHVREVVKKALDTGASNIVLSHNHPTGDLTPSEADLILTEQLAKACAAVGIKLIDHVIVCRNKTIGLLRSGIVRL